MLIRYLAIAIALALPAALTSFDRACLSRVGGRADTIGDTEFARLVTELSEEGGYFWSNNYISNETSYQHVLEGFPPRDEPDGVYIGVGPNQNFTYIAATRPELAIILDIRRQNMLEHLLFKILMESAESRAEYLSRLLSRPLSQEIPADASLPEIVEAIEASPPDEAFHRAQLDYVLEELARFPDLGLTADDVQNLRLVYREFYRQGFDIKYDSWRSFFFPSLKEFMLETDLAGRHRNWLASEATFSYVRDMERENRIVPVVGDFAGQGALRRIGRYLGSRGMTVSTFYLSNVEFYLFRQRKWQAFVDNVVHLPTDGSSVFIRAYANLHRPHPKMVDDHITVTLVQNIESFLRNARAGRYHNLWDVVTADEF